MSAAAPRTHGTSPVRSQHGLPVTVALPLTAWLSGGVLALVLCGITGVATSVAVRAAAVVAAVGLAVGLAQLVAYPATRGLVRWFESRGASCATALASAITVLLAPAILLVTTQALSGRRMTALRFHSLLAGAAMVVLATVVFACARAAIPHARRLLTRPRFHSARIVAATGLVTTFALLVTADTQLLVRRYDWFHLTLALAGVLCLQGAVFCAVATPATFAHRPPALAWRSATGMALVMLTLPVALGLGAAETLWRDGEAGARATLFAHEGAVALSLELLRPRRGFAAPIARPTPASRVTGNESLALPTVEARFLGADVVLVTVDALRADHLGFAGYRRPTSPNLDALANRSTVFERAYTPSPHTSFALASILTGRHSFSLARAGQFDGVKTLADVFGQAGYRTTGLFPPAVFFVERERFAALESRRYGFAEHRFESLEELRDAPVRTDQAIAALETPGQKPAFVWAHYFGPHEPYVHHPDLEGTPLFGTRAIDRYDEEIRYVDREIGRLVDFLERRGRPYLLVITADHGEEFGEHGGAYHGTSLFEEQIHVPLIIRIPGGGRQRVAEPVSTVDIAATVASLAGLGWRAPDDGVDRARMVRGGAYHRQDNTPPALAELESLKALMTGSQKLICDTARDYCRLFRLDADPQEGDDLADKQPETVRQLRATLTDWLLRLPSEEPEHPVTSLLWAAQRWDAPSHARLGDVLDGSNRMAGATIAERRRAARLVARAPQETHRASLRNVRSDPDDVLRKWAEVSLAILGDADARSALAAIAGAPEVDTELSTRAALALADLDPARAGEALLTAIARESDVSLRCPLAVALGKSRHPQAMGALLSEYDNVRSRICVAKALRWVRDDAVVPFLLDRLTTEPYSTVRTEIVRALGQWRRKSVAAALRATFLTDEDETVTAAAAKAVAQQGGAMPARSGTPIQVPPGARELWVVTAGTRHTGPLSVSSDRRHLPEFRAAIDTASPRDAYSLSLPPGTPSSLRLSAAFSHILFR